MIKRFFGTASVGAANIEANMSGGLKGKQIAKKCIVQKQNVGEVLFERNFVNVLKAIVTAMRSKGMWEYKTKYIVLFHPDGVTGDWNAIIRDKSDCFHGHYWWEKELVMKLNEYGKQGWEVVFIPEELTNGKNDNGFVLFKRMVRADGER